MIILLGTWIWALRDQSSCTAEIIWAFTLISKFQDAEATICDADSTVKALVEASQNAKLQVEKLAYTNLTLYAAAYVIYAHLPYSWPWWEES